MWSKDKSRIPLQRPKPTGDVCTDLRDVQVGVGTRDLKWGTPRPCGERPSLPTHSPSLLWTPPPSSFRLASRDDSSSVRRLTLETRGTHTVRPVRFPRSLWVVNMDVSVKGRQSCGPNLSNPSASSPDSSLQTSRKVRSLTLSLAPTSLLRPASVVSLRSHTRPLP